MSSRTYLFVFNGHEVTLTGEDPSDALWEAIQRTPFGQVEDRFRDVVWVPYDGCTNAECRRFVVTLTGTLSLEEEPYNA